MERLVSLINQTKEMRKTPEQRKEERRAKASKNLQEWVKKTDLSKVLVDHVGADGKTRKLTVEQLRNFEF